MGTKFTFKKEEKLCSKKLINSLFERGRWLRSEHLRLVYLNIDEEIRFQAQILFSVPKKLHRRAVKRNLIKRKLREVYRLNKPLFYPQLKETDKKLILAVVYSSPEIAEYNVLRQELKYLLLQVVTRISRD